ncbi:MAG: hypothetical protein J6D27_03430 [Ruminiclostridium sp.]|nr:hypothetical protein [Ruminiclostridium sp.]
MVQVQLKNGRRLLFNQPDIFIELEGGCVVLRKEERVICVLNTDRIQAVFITKK